MQSEVDVALVVFFGAVSFLSTSSVLYKIISAFTFTSSSIVAIYRLFSVQLALVSTVLFSVITGAKSSEWRCSVSAFAVMYCNLSVCASVLLLTKINRFGHTYLLSTHYYRLCVIITTTINIRAAAIL